MLKNKKKKPLLRRPVFWVLSLLVIAAFTSGWLIWRGIYSLSPRFNFLLISANSEPQKILSGEKTPLHPNDRVKILKVSTNIPLNLGVRLMAKGFDVNALRYEEMSISDLLPQQEIFDRYRFRIQIKYRNQELGYVDWDVEPHSEDWLDKVDRTINADQRLAILERGLRLLPEDKRVWRRLLDEYKSLKRWKQAALMLEEKAGKKLDRDTLSELLEVYTVIKSESGIISVLEKLVKLDPDDLDTRTRLAEAYEKIGKKKAAIKEYEVLLKHMGKRDRLPIYKHLGYLYTETGQNKKAISFYLEAVKLDQKDANLHYNLSYLYEKIHQKEKADFYLGNALALRSEDMENRLKLAKRLINKKELKKAQQYLSEILKEKPTMLEALLLMAQLMEKLGNKKELKKIYEKILSLEPQNETVIYNLGVLEYEAGNISASLQYFDKYIKTHPKDSAIHEVLFDIYKRQKNVEMALKEAQILVELNPKEVDPYYYIFEQLNARQDYQKIIPVMEKGLESNPQQLDFREYLVLAYLKTGNEALAIEQMEEIIKVRPKDINLLLNLARLSEKNGKLVRALEAYKKIVEISPGHEEAEEAYLKLRLEGVQGEGAR